LNWSNLSWDINGDDGTAANASFTQSSITSAYVTNASTLTVTLTSDGKTTLEATTGFGAVGNADTIDVTAGFIKDIAGNPATTDGKLNAAVTYTDQTGPAVSSFTSTTANGSYGVDSQVNITATVSEAVIAGSAITVTLSTNDTLILTAAAAGNTLSGTYTVSTGDASTDLSISSYELASSQAVTDIYGNQMTSTTIPNGSSLSDNSNLVIDAIAPTSTVTSVSYNGTSGVLTFTGTNFDSIGAANASTDIQGSLNWSNLSWDVNGDDGTTANASFTQSSITSVNVTNASTLTVTLTSGGKTALEATTGFGAVGNADTIDVTAGFIKDIAGNLATTDGKANAAVTYSDTTSPTVSSFTSTTANGSYGVDKTVNITATVSEAVIAGSEITVTLSTNDTVILTADTAGATLLSGTYTVSTGDASADLEVTSISLASGQSVTDIYGNTMTSTTIPANNNLSDNQALIIDTKAVFALGTATTVQTDSGNSTADAGDIVRFLFSEEVANTGTIDSFFTSTEKYGISGTSTAWSSNSGKNNSKLEVTLGSGETYSFETITLSSVLDSAGNSSDLTYTVV
jgi:hypothetical protein